MNFRQHFLYPVPLRLSINTPSVPVRAPNVYPNLHFYIWSASRRLFVGLFSEVSDEDKWECSSESESSQDTLFAQMESHQYTMGKIGIFRTFLDLESL